MVPSSEQPYRCNPSLDLGVQLRPNDRSKTRTYQHRSIRLRPKTSFNTTIGLCRILRQIEILKSFEPRARTDEAVARPGSSCGRKNKRGLKACTISQRPAFGLEGLRPTATCIVLACPTKDISELHASRSMTAPTKMGPFIAFDAAINAPSGDQLSCQLPITTHEPRKPNLRRRKNVLDGEFWKGSETIVSSCHVSVFQTRTVLSSDYLSSV